MKLIHTIDKYKWGYIFVAPWIVLFCIFGLYPIWLSIKLTFLKYNLLEPSKVRFVGLNNWFNGIRDGMFWLSLRNIVYNQVIFIALTFFISLGVAICLYRIVRFSSFFRTAYFMPVITSIVVVMIVLGYISGPEGPLQTWLLKIGVLKHGIYWKIMPPLVMPVLAVINSWKWFGIQAVIFLGGISAIPTSYYEAAELDGATTRQMFWRITFPLLRPQVFFILVMNVIYGLQMFTEVYVNFDLYGGVHHAGLTPVLYIYAIGLDKFRMGYASTLGILLGIIILFLTILEFKFIKRRVD